MRTPFVITVTSPRPGFDPATVNASANHGPDAHAMAKAESNENPEAVVIVWKRTQIVPENCGECRRPLTPSVSYHQVAIYVAGIRWYPEDLHTES